MKSSLRFLSEDTLNVTRPALLWRSALYSHRDTEKSFIKARIMTGTYKLQAHESMYNPAVSDTCPLCGEGTEDRRHFLVVCTSLTMAREAYLSHIRPMMYFYNDELCQTPIDCTHTSLSDILARDLIFSIHVRRGQILATYYPVKQRRQRATQPQPQLQTLTTSCREGSC